MIKKAIFICVMTFLGSISAATIRNNQREKPTYNRSELKRFESFRESVQRRRLDEDNLDRIAFTQEESLQKREEKRMQYLLGTPVRILWGGFVELDIKPKEKAYMVVTDDDVI